MIAQIGRRCSNHPEKEDTIHGSEVDGRKDIHWSLDNELNERVGDLGLGPLVEGMAKYGGGKEGLEMLWNS